MKIVEVCCLHTVKWKSACFKTNVFDLVKYLADKDYESLTVLNPHNICHRDAELDKGWSEFNVTDAALR